MKNKQGWFVWREITIPRHKGTEDLLVRVEKTGMHVESWAKDIILAHRIPPRELTKRFPVARESTKDLLSGHTCTGLASIDLIKFAGQNSGLGKLDIEKILALRLNYQDQPREWMPVAMRTRVDKDKSHLDLVLVNDGSRIDIRTNWAFPNNEFQIKHEWFWEIL